MHRQRRKAVMAAIFKDVPPQQEYVLNTKVGVSDHVHFCLCVYVLRNVAMCRAVCICVRGTAREGLSLGSCSALCRALGMFLSSLSRPPEEFL